MMESSTWLGKRKIIEAHRLRLQKNYSEKENGVSKKLCRKVNLLSVTWAFSKLLAWSTRHYPGTRLTNDFLTE